MGYQGESEKLCEDGHYYSADVASDHYDEACPHCGKQWVWTHEVDWTNGYDENDPNTYKARKVPTGTIDVWLKDHYGNKYATVLQQYEPAADSYWINIAAAAAQMEAEEKRQLANTKWIIEANKKDGVEKWDHVWGYTSGRLFPQLMWEGISERHVQFDSREEGLAKIIVLETTYPDFEFSIGIVVTGS